jgi:hypothetical protein
MIDRDSAADVFAGLGGSEQLIEDLAALVEAGLIEERQSISDTRFAARSLDDSPRQWRRRARSVQASS